MRQRAKREKKDEELRTLYELKEVAAKKLSEAEEKLPAEPLTEAEAIA